MAGLIAWVIVIGGILTALGGGFMYVKHLGAAEERAELQPKIDKAIERANTAEAANLTLQYDVNKLSAACKASAESVDAFRRQQDAAIRESRDLLRRLAAGQQTEQEKRRLDELRRVFGSNEGNDCAKTDRILRDGARKRLLDATGESAK